MLAVSHTVMGKKSNQKKQRSKNTEASRLLQRNVSGSGSSALGDALFSDSPVLQTKNVRSAIGKAATVTDYGYVHSEIKRILFLLLLVVSLLAASVIVNSRTTWLNKAGRDAARLIGLQQNT